MSGWPGSPPVPEDRTWAVLSHASFFVLGVIGPLVVLLTFGERSAYVRRQAVEALNFHLSLLVYAVLPGLVLLVLALLGLPVLVAVAAWALVLLVVFVLGLVSTIYATVAAGRGEEHRYPLCLRPVS